MVERAPDEFTEISEATRLAVQRHVIEQAYLFDPDCKMPTHEAAQAFFAQLSGVVTAAANGLAGASRFTSREVVERLRHGLHAQFDSAFEEALFQKGVANDK